MAKGRNSYKEPVFLFTSSSMRQAAWVRKSKQKRVIL